MVADQTTEGLLRARALWSEYGSSRDASKRQELIEHYMPLARVVAARAYGLRGDSPSAFDDYLQYARVGLIEAVDRYDPGRGVPFEAYAVHRIRGAVFNGVSRESEVAAQRKFWRTRMPDRVESLLQTMSERPQQASLRELMGLTVGLALGMMLDEWAPELVDDHPQSNPYAMAELEQLTRVLRSLVAKLPDRERAVVMGHYFELKEFQALAQEQGVTKGRVSQIHGSALAKLRQLLGERPRLDAKL